MKFEIAATAAALVLLYIAYRVHKSAATAPAFIRVNQSFDATTFGWWS